MNENKSLMGNEEEERKKGRERSIILFKANESDKGRDEEENRWNENEKQINLDKYETP